MSRGLSATVLGLGACTPVGYDLVSTQSAVAAGVMNFEETEILDHNEEPVRAVFISDIPLDTNRELRMKFMLEYALKDVFSTVTELNITELSVFMGLPEALSELENKTITDAICEQAAQSGDITLRFPSSWACSNGRISFFTALVNAINYINQHSERCALVGAVDSLCDPKILQQLSYDRRILAEGVDGFLPGEAAAFAIICKRDHPLAGSANTFDFMGPLMAQEANHYQQESPNLGEALSSVFEMFRNAEYTGSRRVNSIYSCQNNENYWAREFTSAYFRNHEIMPEPLQVDINAEFFGETGAAAGALGLAMTQAKLAEIQASGETPRVLIYGSADNGQVGAILTEANQEIMSACDQVLKTIEENAL